MHFEKMACKLGHSLSYEYCMTDKKIVVIGLGYVGLSFCIEFANKYQSVSFDIFQRRMDVLHRGHDRSLDIGTEELR
jgi:UDP-N-acetyl-D-galactosamine dehydrogenase